MYGQTVGRELSMTIHTADGRSERLTSLGEITVEMLRQTFPEWRIFHSGGTWWAIRGGLQTWDGPRSLLLRSLSAPDLVALGDRLCAQAWLQGLDDEELAEVYRGDPVGLRHDRVGRGRGGGRQAAGRVFRLASAGGTSPRRAGSRSGTQRLRTRSLHGHRHGSRGPDRARRDHNHRKPSVEECGLAG